MYEYNMLNIDSIKLKALGFTDREIQQFSNLVSSGTRLTTNNLLAMGFSIDNANKMRYMFDICIGKIIVETPDDLSKHLRKMFGSRGRIGIQNLEVSKISSVPRCAVVGNIRQKPFDIWNSNQYPIQKGVYPVVDVSSTRITIRTARVPRIKYGEPKSVEGVLEIKGVTSDNKVEVAINKEYCRLCNRFIIVASLRRPEFHLGMCEIICFEGTRVYVYAQNLGTRDTVKYNMGTQRIYAYGLFRQEIEQKLKTCASHIKQLLHGPYMDYAPGNQDYNFLPSKVVEEEEYIEE